MAESGADLIEIGVPFSDPIAEGPTIQRSSERALARGTSLRRLLERVRKLRPRVDLPLLLMGYANPFFAMGTEGFVKAAAEVGVDGVIVPDLPPEEGEESYAAAGMGGGGRARGAGGGGAGAAPGGGGAPAPRPPALRARARRR